MKILTKKAAIGTKPMAVILGFGTTGLEIARSLAKYRIPAVCIGSNSFDPCQLTRFCKKIGYNDLYDEHLIDFLIEFARKQKSKPVLFMTMDENVIMASKHRNELKKYFHYNIPEKEVLETLMNKRLFADFAEKEGFPIPRTFFASSINEIAKLSSEIPYPCIMKPEFRNGAWKKNDVPKAFKIKNSDMLIDVYLQISSLNKNVIIQEWMTGPDSEIYFSLVYFDSFSKPIASFVGKKLRQWPPECGCTSLAVSCEQKYVLNESIRLFRTIGFKGIGSVEFKRDVRDGKFKITEPTVGRSNLQSGIASASGINIPHIAYTDMIGAKRLHVRRQVNGIKWQHERNDLYSTLYYLRNGGLTLKQWRESLRGKKAYSLFALDDPLPFLCFLVSLLLELMRMPFKKLRGIISISLRNFYKKSRALSKENENITSFNKQQAKVMFDRWI